MEVSVEKQYIGFWGIFFITLASIANAMSFGLMSSAGYASVLIFIIAGLFFYIPSALVSTELATSYPSEKGIYDWVTQAFGPSLGTLTVWCQNIGQIIGMPVLFGFTLSCLAYGINQPDLAMNKYFIIIGALIGVWAMIIINLIGIKSSIRAAAISSLFTYLIPILLFTSFTFYWLLSGQPLATPFTQKYIFAHGSVFSNASLLVVAIFMIAGIAQPAYFANLVKKTATYKKAMICASVILLLSPIIGCIAILFVIPVNHINDQLGTIQALAIYFSHLFGPEVGSWFERIIMWMFFLGILSSVSTIFLIASRGMMALAISGMLPKSMAKTNHHNVSVNSMLWLGIISTIMILLYALIPSLTTAFAVMSVVFSIATAIQYILVFASYVKLKKMAKPTKPGAYKIKNNFFAYFGCVGLGCICLIFALIFCFIPPSDSLGMNTLTYEVIIIFGCVATLALPILILKLRKKG